MALPLQVHKILSQMEKNLSLSPRSFPQYTHSIPEGLEKEELVANVALKQDDIL